uniref:Uncharacterized protein n=1 Tax=Clastoptera arizonana TaxID=38151 RepID=A0A1B6EDV2_9HEMI
MDWKSALILIFQIDFCFTFPHNYKGVELNVQASVSSNPTVTDLKSKIHRKLQQKEKLLHDIHDRLTHMKEEWNKLKHKHLKEWNQSYLENFTTDSVQTTKGTTNTRSPLYSSLKPLNIPSLQRVELKTNTSRLNFTSSEALISSPKSNSSIVFEAEAEINQNTTAATVKLISSTLERDASSDIKATPTTAYPHPAVVNLSLPTQKSYSKPAVEHPTYSNDQKEVFLDFKATPIINHSNPVNFTYSTEDAPIDFETTPTKSYSPTAAVNLTHFTQERESSLGFKPTPVTTHTHFEKTNLTRLTEERDSSLNFKTTPATTYLKPAIVNLTYENEANLDFETPSTKSYLPVTNTYLAHSTEERNSSLDFKAPPITSYSNFSAKLNLTQPNEQSDASLDFKVSPPTVVTAINTSTPMAVSDTILLTENKTTTSSNTISYQKAYSTKPIINLNIVNKTNTTDNNSYQKSMEKTTSSSEPITNTEYASTFSDEFQFPESNTTDSSVSSYVTFGYDAFTVNSSIRAQDNIGGSIDVRIGGSNLELTTLKSDETPTKEKQHPESTNFEKPPLTLPLSLPTIKNLNAELKSPETYMVDKTTSFFLDKTNSSSFSDKRVDRENISRVTRSIDIVTENSVKMTRIDDFPVISLLNVPVGKGNILGVIENGYVESAMTVKTLKETIEETTQTTQNIENTTQVEISYATASNEENNNNDTSNVRITPTRSVDESESKANKENAKVRIERSSDDYYRITTHSTIQDGKDVSVKNKNIKISSIYNQEIFKNVDLNLTAELIENMTRLVQELKRQFILNNNTDQANRMGLINYSSILKLKKFENMFEGVEKLTEDKLSNMYFTILLETLERVKEHLMSNKFTKEEQKMVKDILKMILIEKKASINVGDKSPKHVAGDNILSVNKDGLVKVLGKRSASHRRRRHTKKGHDGQGAETSKETVTEAILALVAQHQTQQDDPSSAPDDYYDDQYEGYYDEDYSMMPKDEESYGDYEEPSFKELITLASRHRSRKRKFQELKKQFNKDHGRIVDHLME